MSEIKILEIEIENYRQFYGNNKITFALFHKF